MKKIIYKSIILLFVFSQVTYLFLYRIPQYTSRVDSGVLTSASDTLSNSRLSFYGKASGTYGVGATSFTLKTSGAPDMNTNHLFPRDTIVIGSNNSQTVATISGTTTFQTTTGATNQLADGDNIYATQSATHTVVFTTATASDPNGGAIRVLIPAGDSTSASNNGTPDGASTPGFDFNSITGTDVTCPSGGGATWESATATPSATFGGNLHAFECRFRGQLAASTALTMVIGGTVKLVNPAPKTTHTQGTADTYNVKMQQLDYGTGYSTVDEISVTVAPIEAVLVSATVNPSLTFSISGIATAQTYCGRSTTIATTATAVPFGELTGSDSFYHAAHQISTATNATSGYTIKVAEDDNLRKPGTATTIADTTCDASNCNATTKAKWNSTGTYGWGYSLQNSSATTIAFQHNDATGNCDGTSGACSKAFACNNLSGNCGATLAEQTVANSSAPNSAQIFYLCYRLDYGPTQAAGYYQTRILYYASATF